MEDTYNVKAIILNRRPSGESDSRVAVYSRESGKLELTARGAKKIKSKLAGHLEPISLTKIMVIRGRRYDYVGAAVSENCYGNIKADLTKLAAAGRAVKVVEQLIRPGVADERIFELLKDYFEALERSESVIPARLVVAQPRRTQAPCFLFLRRGQHRGAIQKELYNVNSPADWTGDYRLEMLTQFFVLKLLAELGHRPELSRCLSCAGKIQPGKNRFDLARGGLVCGRCAKSSDANQLAISDDSIKLLRLALKCGFGQLAKVKINKKFREETEKIVNLFFKYSFD